MVNNIPIKTVSGKICGWIKIDDKGNKTATDYTGKILGYYRPFSDLTVDCTGKVIARGDVVSSLIKIE